MRTTLTIDSDVAVALARVRDREALSLKAVVNEALRRGLRSMDAELEQLEREPYSISVWDTGGMRVSVDDVAAALDWAEGDRRP
ncbi:MAG: DUF2191 domain-containing protein [Gemmatimonadetes bacterium]|nr:DUF2191 domain-containing protein [Gemmatimonadota bacterium]MBT8402583.1 DUF2191 domain-containing protein [Gemmatimonadota bacterium]NNF38681.1 DUF2191 domain-containing protein [Gemmatimonadota bacterium]